MVLFRPGSDLARLYSIAVDPRHSGRGIGSALLVAANLEGDHVIGSELALFLVDFLVKGYASDAAIKQRLDNLVVYVLPRINPDGAELMFAPVKTGRRTN